MNPSVIRDKDGVDPKGIKYKYGSLHDVTCKSGKFRNWQYYDKDVDSDEWPRCRPLYVALVTIVLLLGVAVLVAYFTGAFDKLTGSLMAKEDLVPPNPTKPLPSSSSALRMFKKAAVCADAIPCVEIGKAILERDGSAVDSAIATLFCDGILAMQSMGIGGGFLMTIYNRENQTSYTLNAREAAPLNSTENMYDEDPKKSLYTPFAVAVPGELQGYWEAHKRFGKLPWKDLVQPSVDLCNKGYELPAPQYHHLQKIENDTTMRSWFYGADGKPKPPGSIIKPVELCKTLSIIAEKGSDDFYNGELGKTYIEDLQALGGILTMEDLKIYKAKWEDPIKVNLDNGEVLHTNPPPGSGLLTAFIINILDGYKFNRSSIEDTESTILTYHRIVEAFKFAYALRTELADPAFIDIKDLIKNLTSMEYAQHIRSLIKDNGTSQNPRDYGAVYYNKDDHGTAHISIMDAHGDAVTVTSTINTYFGSRIASKRTGMVFNNGMDDFSSPGIVNYHGLVGSPNNAIAPQKRPVSSMSPVIITDRSGDVRIVAGAAGGTKITTATALTIIRSLWFGQNIKEAIDAPRFHHQVLPMHIEYEYGNLDQVIKGLEKLGHKTDRYRDVGSIVCALERSNGTIYGNSDYRKHGDVYGLD